MERLNDLNTQPGGLWNGQLSNAITLFSQTLFFWVRALQHLMLNTSHLLLAPLLSFGFMAAAKSGSLHRVCPDR